MSVACRGVSVACRGVRCLCAVSVTCDVCVGCVLLVC